jgi:hypothetical protein
VGDQLNAAMLESFSDELQKIAEGELLRRVGSFLTNKVLRNPTKLSLSAVGKVGRGTKGLFRGGEEAAKRFASPIKGLREGWRHSSPLPGIEQRAKEMGFKGVKDATQALKTTDPAKYKKLLGGGGEHLLGTAPGTGKTQALAEELSRRGWTGTGKLTKYLPVGNKGLTVGFAGMGIPSIVKSEKATPTGEGGALERGLGELGSAGGMILGTGLGMAPAMGLWYGAQQAGSRIGRILDRVRSGAKVRDAVSAPSPTEAADQLDSIQKYYSGAG